MIDPRMTFTEMLLAIVNLLSKPVRTKAETNRVKALVFRAFEKDILNRAKRYVFYRYHQAEELASNFWLWFWTTNRLSKYDPKSGSFAAWFNTVNYHWFMAELRKPKPEPTVSLDTGDDEEPIEIADPHTPDPLDELVVLETRAELNKAIAQLSDKKRKAFELFSKGYTIEQIASVTNRTEGTVKAHLHEARKQLRTRLADTYNAHYR